MDFRKNNETEQLVASQKRERPSNLILSCYRFDTNRINDIIAAAAKLGVKLNRNQAVRYAIRHCHLSETTTADFAEVVNEDIQRRAS